MKKQILFVFISVLSLMSNTGCGKQSSSDAKMAIAQEQMSKNLNDAIGMPSCNNGMMKKTLKRIIEDCDKTDLICYAYTQDKMSGKWVFIGKCIGYGIPYSTQYTSPSKISNVDVHGTRVPGYYVMPQADPDGLFKPSTAAGTWLMLINPTDGTSHPVYCEPDVLVSPFPLTINVK